MEAQAEFKYLHEFKHCWIIHQLFGIIELNLIYVSNRLFGKNTSLTYVFPDLKQ